MSKVKAGGCTRLGRDSNPKYLGVKLNDGEKTKVGMVIIRQRGTDFLAGKNVGMGKDHTLFALKEGLVSFGYTRKKRFDNTISKKKIVCVK